MSRSLKTYDHRLRELIRQTGDLTIATSAGVPRSTAAGWLRRSGRTTVTLDALSLGQQELQAEVLRLQRRVEKLRAVVKEKDLTWPSFFDGGSTSGPIARAWEVQGWPTIIVIDAGGVIRARDLRGEALDAKIHELLAEIDQE